MKTDKTPPKIPRFKNKLAKIIIANPSGNAPMLTLATESAVAEFKLMSDFKALFSGLNMFLMPMEKNSTDTNKSTILFIQIPIFDKLFIYLNTLKIPAN